MKKFFTQTILLVVALLAGTSAKAVSYKIDGPDKLETNAVYSIVTTDGSALPSGLTATWNYPSDFYRISYTSTTIQLGRKTAEGYYTLSAQLSEGLQTVSAHVYGDNLDIILTKQVMAIDADDPNPNDTGYIQPWWW